MLLAFDSFSNALALVSLGAVFFAVAAVRMHVVRKRSDDANRRFVFALLITLAVIAAIGCAVGVAVLLIAGRATTG